MDLARGDKAVSIWLLIGPVPVALTLFALPPMVLFIEMAHSGFESLALAIMLGLAALLSGTAILLARPGVVLDVDAMRRRLLWLLAIALACGALWASTEAFGQAGSCSESIHEVPDDCSIFQRPLTVPLAVLDGLQVFLLSVGFAALLGLPALVRERAVPQGNARFVFRAAAWLPLGLAASLLVRTVLAWLLGGFAAMFGMQGSGHVVEPRTMESVFWSVLAALLCCAWPLALGVAPSARIPLRSQERSAFWGLLVFLVTGAYGLAWLVAVYDVPCDERCGTLGPATALLGALAGPVLVPVVLVSVAATIASAILAARQGRRASASESRASEVRLLYANGRLTRGDHDAIERACDALVNPGRGATTKEFRGALLVFLVFLSALGLVGEGAIFFQSGISDIEAAYGIHFAVLFLVVCGLVGFIVMGVRDWSAGSQQFEEDLARLKTLHLELIHKANAAAGGEMARGAVRGVIPK